MPALIPQLITMASNPEVKTTDLLRNALVAARKLKQPDWISWIKNELDGYPESAVIPPYRILTGQLYAINPGKGLVLLPVMNAELHEVMTTCPFYYPIDGVEPLASGTEYVVLPMDPSQSKMVAALYKMPIAPQVRFGANQVQRLIGAVRTKVLEWALDLDELGIQGEGMSFTTQEQKQAESVTNIFIGGGCHRRSNDVGLARRPTKTDGDRRAEDRGAGGFVAVAAAGDRARAAAGRGVCRAAGRSGHPQGPGRLP